VPPPHDNVHVLKPDHSDTMQSTGQLCALQPSFSVSAGQIVPSNALAVTTDLWRKLSPPPHDFVQAPQSSGQSVTVQFTGQKPMWHGR
jgi:hypothetical protein